MSVKAVVTVTGVYFDPANPGDYRAQLVGAGVDPTNPVNIAVFVSGIPTTLLPAVLDSALKTAVKNDLTANHGYTFGLLDTVLIVPGVV